MRYIKYLVILAVLALGVTACGGVSSSPPSAAQKSENASNALQRLIFQPTHDVEFKNYNDRLRLADNPATILWCTFFPATVGQEPVTFPIAGKLTSSNKRPYDVNKYSYSDANAVGIAGERPGPDHMFGSSAEYRYGFDPTRTQYFDFTLLGSICTNVPTVWQKNKTTIVSATDPTLASLDRAAEAALKAGNAKKALVFLNKASTANGGK